MICFYNYSRTELRSVGVSQDQRDLEILHFSWDPFTVYSPHPPVHLTLLPSLDIWKAWILSSVRTVMVEWAARGEQRQGGGGIHIPPTDSAVLEILCIFSTMWERKLLKLCLHPKAWKAEKGPLCLKEEAYWYLWVFTPHPGKLAPPLPISQYVTSSPSPSCQLCKSSAQRSLGLGALGSLATLRAPDPCLWLLIPCFTLNLCLRHSCPRPTSTRPILFHENITPRNLACTLTDLQACNSFFFLVYFIDYAITVVPTFFTTLARRPRSLPVMFLLFFIKSSIKMSSLLPLLQVFISS